MESIAKKVVFIFLTATLTFGWLGRRVIGDKSIITKVKTTYGHVYDCVDIYKQPALSHPALKDPKVKNKIIEYIRQEVNRNQGMKNYLEEYIRTLGFWEDIGCPIGSVPYPDPLAVTHFKSDTPSFNHSLMTRNPTEFAGIFLDGKTGTRGENIYDATAYISIWNPQVAYKSNQQYTSASIILESEDNSNQLQVGWMVNPYLFGDSNTRLYMSMRVTKDSGDICYNIECKAGFIQVSHFMPPGFVFSNITEIGKYQVDSFFGIIKMRYGWEFRVGKLFTLVGLFPDYLFTTMRQFANRARLGGQIYAPLSDEYTPQMGSGFFRNGAVDKTCYMRNVIVNNYFPNESFVSESRCYFASSIARGGDFYWDSRFLFGGTGGKDGDTCVY